ncbi:phage minor capsid protein [Clostridium sp. Ade.TY]|uniref:phage minor capsid protein n=1 Tax=Clostridium sp. Ade.TY TaxID=1391647 RepID=UPI000412E410|nr:phage minor capsid protein [Clostridium sp. Ade.TY]
MDKKNNPSKLSEVLEGITKKKILEDHKKERDKSYDIRKIFEEMELALISSMHKAFYFHKKQQQEEGFNWEQWQRTKLRELEKYRKRNKKIVENYNKPIQEAIDRELEDKFISGQQYVEDLVDKVKVQFPEDIKETQTVKGYIANELGKESTPPRETNFFGVNEKKLNALQETVTNDLKKAQYSVLRKMDDVYRQTIFKTHVYLQSGTKTINQSVDMATKDFLDKGINSIVYKDGKQVNIASYAEMCLRTASQRATFLGEGKKRDEFGIHLVVVSAHANTCKMCGPWQGKVLIDDIFSHGIKEDGDYPLLSEAVGKGFLHPNCRHTLITYFPGITRIPAVPDGEEAIKLYEKEQKQRYYERQLRKWKRFEAGTCDEESKNIAHNKVKELQNVLRKHIEENKQLRRNYNREEARAGLNIEDDNIKAEVLKQKALNAKIKETREYIKTNQPLKIEVGKQGKHILGHNNYIEGRSYLTISLEEAQELINNYAGTGEIRLNYNNEWDNKEIIKVNKDIGVEVNNRTNKETITNRFKVHYSKKGTHIVPMRRE